MKRIILVVCFNLLLVYLYSQSGADPYDSGADAYYKSGIVKFDLKDYKGAIADYDKSLEKNPNYKYAYRTYYNRGMAKIGTTDYEGAIKDFTQSIKLNNYVKAYGMRGVAKAKLKDDKGAISDFTKAIQLFQTLETVE